MYNKLVETIHRNDITQSFFSTTKKKPVIFITLTVDGSDGYRIYKIFVNFV